MRDPKYLINTGKFELFNIILFKLNIKLEYYITEDCSIRLREYGLIKFTIFKEAKLKYQKLISLIKITSR